MKKELKSSILLLLAAAIWGLAFVAQRIGSKYLGSFTFNGIRFALGGISLIPLILYFDNKPKQSGERNSGKSPEKLKRTIRAGIVTGCILFLGASFQQIGLVETSAGKAAFITGLYIVLVPIFGVFLKHHIYKSTWIAVVMAIIGLYLLSVTESFTISKGDLFEIAGAFFWTAHILLIDRFTRTMDGLKLSLTQSLTCSILSLIMAFAFEKITLYGLSKASIAILYGGICSVGVAYTLQVIGQKDAKPSHAAIILSMEAVFASIGGLLILHENMPVRGYVGCALMLSGMLLSQVGSFGRKTA